MGPTNQRAIPRLLLVIVALLVIARVAFAEERVQIDARTSLVADDHQELTLVRGKRVIWRGSVRDPVRRIMVRDLVGDTRPEVIIEYENHARNPATGVYRYDGKSLTTIAELANYWDFLTIDFDGDGRQELIETACCDPGACATGIYTGLLRYDGQRFVRLPMDLTEMLRFGAAGGAGTLSNAKGDYVAHLISEGGRACGWIRDGDKNVIFVSGGARTHRRVHLDDKCHKLSFSGTLVGSTTLALLLEKKGPEKPQTYASTKWPDQHDILIPNATRTTH